MTQRKAVQNKTLCWVGLASAILASGLLSACATGGIPGHVEAARQPDCSITQEQLAVASYDQRSGNVLQIRNDLISTTFLDGVPVTAIRIEERAGRFFLVREGMAGNSQRAGYTLLQDLGGLLTLPAGLPLRLSASEARQECLNKCLSLEYAGSMACGVEIVYPDAASAGACILRASESRKDCEAKCPPPQVDDPEDPDD